MDRRKNSRAPKVQYIVSADTMTDIRGTLNELEANLKLGESSHTSARRRALTDHCVTLCANIRKDNEDMG